MTRQKDDYENGNVTKPWTKARATNKELKRDFRKENVFHVKVVSLLKNCFVYLERK